MVTRSTFVLVAFAALAALASGCRKNTVSIQPYKICSMPNDCVFKDKCDMQPIGPLEFDPSGGQEMWLAFELHNQLTANNNSDGQGNTHDAHFRSYSVSYSGSVSGGTDDIDSSGDRTQQIIPASGQSVVGATIFPADALAALAGSVPAYPDYSTVDVEITFKGYYEDGSDWEAELPFSVRLSVGSPIPTCDDPTQVPTACPNVFQSPRGESACVSPPVSCLASGAFCGSTIYIEHGNANTLYLCNGAGTSPTNVQVCPTTCDATASPNVCAP